MTEEAYVASLLAAGFQQCHAVITSRGGLLLTLFLTGLVGGATHCVGMCGPFVLSQVTARLQARPASAMREWHRLSGAALVPYHLGRLTTYVGLGAVFGVVAGSLSGLQGLKWLSAGLLLVAAGLFVLYAVPRLRRPATCPTPPASGGSRWQRGVRALMQDPVGLRGYGLGLLLGFLPCGLLYGALAAAAAAGSALAGAMAMAAFALGTVPSLLVVGLAGHVAGQRWHGVVAQMAPLLLLFNAGLLGYMAVRLVV